MKNLVIVIFMIILLAGCSSSPTPNTDPADNRDSTISVQDSVNKSFSDGDDDFYQVGIASWYGGKFNGRRTSNGEIYDMYKLTAAHKELPFNTIVEVENLRNRKKVIVRINDRGPFVKDRIIDLSYKAAISLEMDDAGTAPVALRIVDLLDGNNGRKIVVRKIDYSHRSEFYLQAGAFSMKENAESLVSRLNYYSADAKFKILVENGFNKVISTRITSRKDVEKLKRTLEDLGFDTFIKEVFLEGEKK
ncbi:MAG: septal ring lytic transglycosylase RlpA family protein [Acidobacteriota bacterium]